VLTDFLGRGFVPFLIVIGLVGSWMGKKVLVFIPQTYFRKISLLLILIIGLITLGARI